MRLSSLPLRLPSTEGFGAWWTGTREFFAYHGVWAPGVRLLRQMTVRGKVLVVLALIAAPLVPLTVHVVVDENLIVEEAERKLAALHLAESTSALRGEINRRKLADEGAPSPQAATPLAQVYARLVHAYEQVAATSIPLRADWERLRPDLEKVVHVESSAPETQAVIYGRAYEASSALSRAVVLRSNIKVTDGLPLYHKTALALEQVPALQQSLFHVRALVRRQLQAGPRPAGIERHAAAIELASAVASARSESQRVLEGLEALHGGDSTQATASVVDAYLHAVEQQVLAWEATPERESLTRGYAAAREQLRALRTKLTAEVAEVLVRHQHEAERTRGWVFAALLGALGLAAYLLYCFFLVMRGGLVQLNQQMNRMAQGDLSARLTPLGVDEVAATMHAMTTSLVRLSDLMASVRNGVGAVTQASQQVALGNADLSRRNHETSQSLGAVVDGVARYGAQLEACGRQVETVVSTVQALRLEAARNRKQMQRLRERMASLRSKSREIGEIVTLIDAIAFRTNILALNASVEASKAGESGRGFAVVAQEVRGLAMRGAESARRIGDIVARSSEDIEQSGLLADETGQAMVAADQHVDHIHVAMDDVASLTRTGEQESAAILAQLTQISDATTHGLRLVEQLATASDQLRSQGERLAHKVGQFQLS